MAILASIAEWSVLTFALLLLVTQFLGFEAGHWLGGRARLRADAEPESVGAIVGGMLALMTFVLALTLAFANSRFDERRAGALAEANAIGTGWMRAKAISGPRGEEIGRLLEQYAQVRQDFARAGRDRAAIDQLTRQTNVLQNEMWGHVAAIVREQPNPVSASLMAALNETFDRSTAERFAFDTTLPKQIFWLLLILTLLSMGSLGYQLGLKGKAQRILVMLLMAMLTAVIVDILDLASPRIGAFRGNIAVYDWTRQGFEGGVTIPPLPAAH